MAAPKSEGDILRVIGRIEQRESEALTDAEYDRIVEWLAHPWARVRQAAAHAFTLAGAEEETATHLFGRLSAEAEPEVKAQVLDSLIMLATMEQDQVEMDLTDEEEEPEYETAASPWYRQVRDTLLRVAGDTSEAEPLRAAAIGGLGDLSDDPALKGTYLPYLGEERPALRIAALQAVSYSGDPLGAEGVLLAGIEDPDPEIRKMALLACGNTHLEAATEMIRPLLTAADLELQGTAWYAFAGCAPIEEARAFLERVGAEIDESDPRWDDYDAAQYVLGERDISWDGFTDDLSGVGLPDDQEPEGEPEVPPVPAPTTVRRATPKVGRNEPCPCGSGKKYKKCCGA